MSCSEIKDVLLKECGAGAKSYRVLSAYLTADLVSEPRRKLIAEMQANWTWLIDCVIKYGVLIGNLGDAIDDEQANHAGTELLELMRKHRATVIQMIDKVELSIAKMNIENSEF